LARRKLLIYRLGSLGDTIVALPCFHLLARTYADCERILLTNDPVHAKAPAAWSVLGESGLIHSYISYSVSSRNISEIAKLCWRLRRLKIDTVVYLTPPRGERALRRDETFFRLCGVNQIIGVPHGELGTHRYDPVADSYEAEASRLARCLAPVGDARLDDRSSWDLVLTEEEKAHATTVLRALNGAPCLAVAIASKKQVTDWGIENWKCLMRKLHREFPGHVLVFIGAKEDRSSSDNVAAEWLGASLNLSGDLSPRESAAVMRRADLFLGIDSGPMHLAASVGTPCVSIFAAHQRPGTWFPFGKAHEVIYHKTGCFGCNLAVCTAERKKCILSISPDEVVVAAARAGARKRAAAHAQSR
jgi:heptosyltransferase III